MDTKGNTSHGWNNYRSVLKQITKKKKKKKTYKEEAPPKQSNQKPNRSFQRPEHKTWYNNYWSTQR